MALNGFVVALILLSGLVIGLRQYQKYRVLGKKNAEPFAGLLYSVGAAVVAVRDNSEPPGATVIAMHGFMEDHRYFVDLYARSDLELILITSADYHVPVDDAHYQEAAWAAPIHYAVGTIEYDAVVLNLALEYLPTTEKVRVHGHSRGGAVVLEAAAQRPDLHRSVETILEAPVLPQAGFHPNTLRNFGAMGLWLLPLTLPLLARVPLAKYGAQLYGSLGSPRKQALLGGVPYSAKHYATLIANSKSIREWVRSRNFDIYQHVGQGVILVGEDERILDRQSMLNSAAHAGGRLRIIEVPGTTHFVTQDDKTCVPPL